MERKYLIIWLSLPFIIQLLVPAEALTGHVCHYTYYIRNTRTTSCGLWGWRRCTRYYQSQRTGERCCDGWRQIGTSCTTPICSTPCYNGGTCIAPEVCKCQTSFSGQNCATHTN